MNPSKIALQVGVLLSVFCGTSCQIFPSFPYPPAQPESGPGGREYAHQAVKQTVVGEGISQYWVYEPDDPAPETAPLIVFVHGWGATNPVAYGAWIKHLVQRGNIVIYPRYQVDMYTPSEEYLPAATQAVKNAMAFLQSGEHVVPDPNRFAIVGHSVGGFVAAAMAASAQSEGLPQPKALMSVEPIGPREIKFLHTPVPDFGTIPPDTLFLAVAGDQDQVVGVEGAQMIYNSTPQIPPENKDYILVISDDHGRPALQADHYAPAAIDREFDSGEHNFALLMVPPTALFNTVNAQDFYGYWKLLDGLTDAAFYGKNREYALGNTPEQRFMGVWSDGVPVAELLVTDSP